MTGRLARSRWGIALSAVVTVVVVGGIAWFLVGRSTSGTSQASGTPTSTTQATASSSTSLSEPTPTSSATPSEAASTTATPTYPISTPTPQRIAQVPATIPAGPDLAIPYYEGRTYGCPGTGDIGYHPAVPTTGLTTYIYPGRGNGDPIPVRLGAKDKVLAFTQLGERYLLAVTDCTASVLRSYAIDGTYKTLGPNYGAEHPFSTGIGRVAVTVGPHQVTLYDAATAKKLQTWTLPKRFEIPSPTGILPDGSVLVTGFIKGGQKDRILHPDGSVTQLSPVLQYAEGVNPVTGDVVNWLRTEACKINVAVFDALTKDPLWVDCGYSAFYPGAVGTSPDGKLIAALAGPRGMRGRVSFLDAATGDVPLEFTHGPCPNRCIFRPIWEDDTHLVFQEYLDKDPFSLFRYGLNGKVTTVSVAQPPAVTGGFQWILYWRQ